MEKPELEELEFDISELVKELQNECENNRNNVLSLIVTGHLMIEEILDSMICQNFNDVHYYLKANLTFFQKAYLTFSRGAVKDKRVRSCILFLNELRNKFAHNRKYKLVIEDIEKITISKKKYSNQGEDADKIVACICSICGYLAYDKSVMELMKGIANNQKE